jgi:hypothetical protein
MGMGQIERDRRPISEFLRQERLAYRTTIQRDSIRINSKVPAQHRPQASVSQYVALSGIFPNKASRSVSLDFIKPARASLQAALRPVELDAPEVNGILFKTDMIPPACIGQVLNGLEADQHIVTSNAAIACAV